ncbi:Dyp-type peroxidase [Streptomyces sp. NPDC021093]|uniref:Dyp-type peroxidase n=1 Tax=Streptomyces sp. NPDC021093 TaxID=3365112 RepID=UPI00379F5199
MNRRAALIAPATAVVATVGGGLWLSCQGRETGKAAAASGRLQLGQPPAPHAVFVSLDRRDGGRKARRNDLKPVLESLDELQVGGLEARIGLGASLLGQHGTTLRHLRSMPAHAGDVLDPHQCHGDVLLQIAGPTAGAVRTAARQVLSRAHGWRVRWRIEGAQAAGETVDGRALARNPFHFTEGFGNPDSQHAANERALVRPEQGQPKWAVGGTYQVVRIIRMATELWDADPVETQEQIIGRRRDGRWLDGTPAGERANFASDPKGKLTPLDSHVRLAAPNRRTPPPILRRSYSYVRDDGDRGMIFSCFQRDLAEGFEAVQRRLEGEAMAKYLLTTGGGYFFVPPPGDAWIERALHP